MAVEEKIKVGVCVMEKKVFSAPMGQIFDRLQAFGEFEVIHFGDKVILEDPIESWPVCDCLIAFYSSGYPLEKAEAYAALRKPFIVNELEPQHLLHDRRKVYERLEMFGIPVPRYALVIREVPYQELDYFIEEEDFVEVHGMRFWKPFVEKPVDADNHSIMIYYPSSAGGGMKELFRKVGNRSSEFHSEVRRVRREGSYIYEEFMPTGGTDVKVYTVGPEYAHAEARKSPVVDGVVMRNPDGKEVRYPVLLTPAEKEMARKVCIAFSQAVCGFDLLRSEGRSYVCDVNGWSFVKNSHKYYDDSACVLRKMLLDAKAPHLSSVIPPTLPWKVNELVQPSEALTRQGSGINGTFGQSEELRCVIAVIRHGDRTPKQKVKLKVTEEKLLNLILKYNGGRPRTETKLKSAVQLQDLLDATRMLVPCTRLDRESDSEAEDVEHAEKLRQVKAVLEEGGHFSGIYRKVQLKPLKWAKVTKSNGEVEERPVEALMVLKYGGVLTHAGRKQAEELGRYFRYKMYPGEGTGLLRLHSTYRHDLKIYSSDEGRVQMSAAAFAKGLLDLEGQLTPILVSLVSKDSSMLDGLENASIEMEDAKARLNEIITSSAKTVDSNGSPEFPWMVDGVGLPPNASELLPELVKLTKKVTEQVRLLAKDEGEQLTEKSLYDVIPPYDQAKALGKTNIDVDRIAAGLPCGSEGFLLMYARWKKLERDLYNERKERFDITQIPDVYDSCKYDLLHNAHLNLEGLDELFKVAQALADGVIPNEYGINPKQKLKIGSKIARRLLGKLLIDLRNTREEAISVAELKNSQDHNSLSINIEKEDAEAKSKNLHKNDEMRKSSTLSLSDTSMDQDDDDDKETKYRLDPKYANVKTPERHVRTRLYFTSESHIHSLMNVLRYCNLDESLQGEESLVCHNALERLCTTKELDYMSYIVLRMFENTEVALEDPKRYRIELTFSRGADLSPLEKKDSEATSLHQEHTLPIMGPERLQEVSSYLTLETMEKMIRPFAMPAEDFPPPATPAGFSGYFSKSVLERLSHRAVMDSLNEFCLASGLKVNFEKSKAMCSSKVPRQRQRELSQYSSIQMVKNLGNYLGFPLINGRVNKNHYNSIVERIQKRMAAWKSRLLNKAGKLCLVKSVSSSIPVYTMQTHLLPKSVCSKIDSITRNFFWGRGDQHQSWHLINWEVLRTPRNLGGLGIRDSRLTNLALLGKLVWSLLHERDKLWVQVLTHKYLDHSIWKANNRRAPSLIWRSIVKAIEALKQGFTMRINAGDSSLWYSDWTGTGPLCELVDYVNISDTQLCLNHVWNNGAWDLERLATTLPNEVKEIILATPTPSNPNLLIPDRWVWNGCHGGIYSAASGYHWLLNNTNTLPQNQDWKWVWKTCAPAKVQLLIWQILHSALPTNALRFVRGLGASPGCQRCSVGNETMLHVLRDCPHSREVWYRSGLKPSPSFFRQTCASEWIKQQAKGNHECLFLAGLWWLWCWRNNMVLGDDSWNAQQVTRNMVASAYDYNQFLSPRRRTDNAGLPHVRWQGPSNGKLKLNVDGSFNISADLMCTGGLLRDALGKWNSGFSSVEGPGDALLAELIAVRNGLQHAWNEGVRLLLCESDCLEVVQLLTEGKDHSFHVHAGVIEEILQMAQRDWSIQFSHVMREANMCSDYLARNAARETTRWKTWNVPPPLLEDLLLHDSLQCCF